MALDEIFLAVDTFVDDVNRGDLDAAASHYLTEATFVSEPGQVACGVEAIRRALADLIASGVRIRTLQRDALVSADLALYQSRWALLVGGEVVQEANSCDVLRRDAAGRWRIAIDNPWGSALLAPATAAQSVA